MTVTDYLSVAAAAAVIAALIGGLLYAISRWTKPSKRIEREVQEALTDPVYAPYGADGLDRFDYVTRAQVHQPCDAWPCAHTAVHTLHCRCGQPWVCELAGPLNTNPDAPIPNQRNRNEERRWPL